MVVVVTVGLEGDKEDSEAIGLSVGEALGVQPAYRERTAPRIKAAVAIRCFFAFIQYIPQSSPTDGKPGNATRNACL